ncbi:MAG: hypothetical protein KJP21_02230 [Bacteroidia bacterium]|nr:hypothetical protein [Bacteroidia bacterium]NNJ56720.1 hypothetical protein [Bacteroidia bacterium]
MFCGLRKWIGVMVAICIAASFYSFTHIKPYVSDSGEYFHAAHNLLYNNTLYSGNLNETLDFRLFSKRTLGYPLYLILQNSSTIAITLSQICLVVLNFVLGIFVLRKLKVGTKVFSLYGIFYCATLILFIHPYLFLSDLLLMTVVSLIVLVIIETRLYRKKDILLLALLWGAALLIKPIILPSLLLIPLVGAYLLRRKISGTLYLTIPVLVWLLIGAHNYSNTKQFETSSISTINLTQYNAKLSIAHKYGFDSAQKYVESDVFIVPRNAAEYAGYKTHVKSYGLNAIKDNFKSYFKVHVLGMVKMAIDPGRFELYTFFGEPTSNVSLTELIFDGSWNELFKNLKTRPVLLSVFLLLTLVNLLKLLGLVGLFKTIDRWHLLILGIIGYFIVISGPVGAARFILPATPICLVLVALGWSNLLQKSPKS